MTERHDASEVGRADGALDGALAVDRIPPATITDLRVTTVTDSSVTLAWTAPGDDENIGIASAYDLRYATSRDAIDAWSSASAAPTPSPSAAGTTESLTISDLAPGTMYWIAIATADEVPSWSAISSAVSATTEGAPPSTLAAPPRPPEAYTIPAGAIAVSTTSALIDALGSSTPADIVIEDGTYTHGAYVELSVGHRLWARTLGGVTLGFGLVLGGNTGAGGQELHGLVIDVADPALAFQGGVVNTWGAGGVNVRIADCWIRGHGALYAGILARQPEGLVVSRVVVHGFTDYGIFFQVPQPDLTTSPTTPVVIEDADILEVSRAVPGSSNGTAEAGLWAGNDCRVRRVRVRATGWSGIETVGNVNDSLFEDIDVADIRAAGVGIYIEHFTRRTTFRRVVTSDVRIGLVSEWADPVWTNPIEGESRAGGHDNVLESARIESRCDGVSLDEGTDHMTLQSVELVGQANAGIRDYLGVGNVFVDIDTSGILPSAVAIATEHASAGAPCE